MKFLHESVLVLTQKPIAWFLLGLAAIFSWVVIFADIGIWSALLSPGYIFERYACILLAIVGLGGPFCGGLVSGSKILILASNLGFCMALLRGYAVSHFGQDCADFCLGILNRVLGLGCGSAGEGCAFETYLLVFFAVELFFWIRFVLLRRYQSAK